MIPTWVKVVIGIFAVVVVLGIIWLVLWFIGMGGSSPLPSPGPSPSSGVIKPSEYTGQMTALNPPTTQATQCGTTYTAAEGVGWVLDNQTTQNFGLDLMFGRGCGTASPTTGVTAAIPLNAAPCPGGEKMTWTEATFKHPLAVGQGVIVYDTTTAKGRILYVPPDINPATQYVVFTVSGATGAYTYSVDTYNY